MKSKSLLILVFLVFSLALNAQNISVADFQLRLTDMTATSKEGKRIDQNGQPAALIRIETTERGFVFEAGALGIVDSKQETGEVWVWVPRASRKITIKHPQLGVLYDYMYPIEIEAERTYWMKLVTAKVKTVVEEEVRMQFLTFQITPVNATLEVNDELWSVDADGIATKYVDFGTYNYRVRAADYFTDAGKVTVNDPDNTKIVTISLKSNRAEVTLKVDADAEIWVNNEKKGYRSWTGFLGEGTYKMECKQAGHEPSVISKEITAEMNGQTITLPAPTPIYGSLIVMSTPQMANLYIDGEEMGKTPRSINELLVGQHIVKLSKDGYSDYSETVTIVKGEKKQVNATLSQVMVAESLASKPVGVKSDVKLTTQGDDFYNKKNYETAFWCYLEAAKLPSENNNGALWNRIGWMYRQGQGTTKDYNEAVKWFRKSAEQGNQSWLYV